MEEELLMEKEEESKKKAMFVIAPNGFKDEEYYIPKGILEENNIEVVTASLKSEAVSVKGKKQKIDILLDSADINYDAIIFIGGPGTKIYFENAKAHELAYRAHKKKKIVAAICIAPVILAKAGILTGKRATVFPSGKDELIEKGAKYIEKSVVEDGNILTANGPDAAKEFGEKLAEMLS